MMHYTKLFKKNQSTTIINQLLTKYNLLFSASASTNKKNPQTKSNQNNKKQLILKSKYSNIDIPDINLIEFIFRYANNWIDNPAITCGITDRSYTYRTVQELNVRMAKIFLSPEGCNLKPNDTIGLVLPNLPEFVPCICGALLAGLRVTFANPLYSPDEILRQFENANVKLIITISDLFKPIEYIANKLSTKCNGTIFLDKILNAPKQFSKNHKIYDYETLLLLVNITNQNLPIVNSNQISIIPYSSGTSGLPKGVQLTHRNCIANIAQITHSAFLPPHLTREQSERETLLTIPPFFHIYGYNGVLNTSLYLGRHIVTLPKFNAIEYIEALKKYRPAILFVVPSLLLFIASHPNVTSEHLASVTHVIVGAAAATQQLQDKFHQKCNKEEKVKILHGYGMSESSPVTLLSAYNSAPEKSGSVGQLISNTEARIVSLSETNGSVDHVGRNNSDGYGSCGEDLGPYLNGELYIRGPQVMLGYLNNQKATNEILDCDGWLHTGDVAYYDDDEYFYIVDRTKELIKVKGNQVSPTELENLILELDYVIDVAVTGIPNDVAGEIPRAFVVVRPGTIKNDKDMENYATEIKKHISEKTIKYKWLVGGVYFLETIPRNPSGKIIRNQLKKS